MRYYNSDYKKISQSMLKVFMKSKEYYYKKFIEKSIPDDDTEALRLGQAIDCYTKHGKEEFLSTFSYKVLKKDNPSEYMAQQNGGYSKTLLTENSFEIAKAVGERLRAIPDVEFLNQHALKDVRLEKGNLIGELDYLYVDDERAVIVDLKTSENVDKRPFYYKTMEYGYYVQMAYYRDLVRQNYPNIKTIECYILAAEKDKFAPRALFYKIPDAIMDRQDKVITEALSQLNQCLAGILPWKDPDPTFRGAQDLQLINETYNDII